jgi:hypothetical protein
LCDTLYLADSNIDWGEDEYLLDAYIASKQPRPVHKLPQEPCSGLIAVNVNTLLDIIPNMDSRMRYRYHWLRNQFQPVDNVAYSWLIYDVPEIVSLGDENFSAQWSGLLAIDSPGEYQFFLLGDDPARLMIDKKAIIDTRRQVSGAEISATTFLRRGLHRLHLAYAHVKTLARLQLAWLPPGQQHPVVIPPSRLYYLADHGAYYAGGINSKYFTNSNFTDLKVTGVDAQIQFDWGSTSPVWRKSEVKQIIDHDQALYNYFHGQSQEGIGLGGNADKK